MLWLLTAIVLLALLPFALVLPRLPSASVVVDLPGVVQEAEPVLLPVLLLGWGCWFGVGPEEE
jgi:hypothetical protein